MSMRPTLPFSRLSQRFLEWDHDTEYRGRFSSCQKVDFQNLVVESTMKTPNFLTITTLRSLHSDFGILCKLGTVFVRDRGKPDQYTAFLATACANWAAAIRQYTPPRYTDSFLRSDGTLSCFGRGNLAMTYIAHEVEKLRSRCNGRKIVSSNIFPRIHVCSTL